MIDLEENEIVVFNKPANLFRGFEAVGGRLKMTNKRLIFQSHLLNIQTGTTEIPLAEVHSVTPCNTLGIIPNGILVKINTGKEYNFVISNRKQVINLIHQYRLQ